MNQKKLIKFLIFYYQKRYLNNKMIKIIKKLTNFKYLDMLIGMINNYFNLLIIYIMKK